MVELIFPQMNLKKALKVMTAVKEFSLVTLRDHLTTQSDSSCTNREQIHQEGCGAFNLGVPKQKGDTTNVFAPHL